jgi:RimJ/RimL family protein N-acetyltransferase
MLEQRDPIANISHRRMPSFSEHRVFVESIPYRDWFMIWSREDDRPWVGQIYLSRQNEIGIHILKDHSGDGYGKLAVRKLIALRGPGRYLANVAPRNYMSQALFEHVLGFGLIQRTYEFIVPESA